MIAALKQGRNILYIENNSINYIHAKIRAVKSMSLGSLEKDSHGSED